MRRLFSVVEQENNHKKYAEFYNRNYCLQVKDKNRIRYDLYAADGTQPLPVGHIPFDLVCTSADGRFIRPEFVDRNCHRLSQKIEGLDGFHFHSLRHTYTSNLPAKGAAPLEARLNKIIAEQKLSKREFAKRVGMSENYLYILTSNSRPGTKQNKTISPMLAKLIGMEFGYDPEWILNGNK